MSRYSLLQACSNADQLELAALLAPQGVDIPPDRSLADEEISHEDVEDPVSPEPRDDVEAAVFEDNRRETAIMQMVSEVIRRRLDILATKYPFAWEEQGGLRYVGSPSLAYEFCLALSSVLNIGDDAYRSHRAAFERLVGVALSSWLGGDSGFLRTGHPAIAGQVPDDPEDFEAWLERMRGALPEEEWLADPTHLSGSERDGGVDTLIWRRMGDRRAGNVILVGNCGCGRNWYSAEKYRERPTYRLNNKLSRPRGYLIDFFAVPFDIIDKAQWKAALLDGGLLLDRLRLTMMADEAWRSTPADVEGLGLRMFVPGLRSRASQS